MTTKAKKTTEKKATTATKEAKKTTAKTAEESKTTVNPKDRRDKIKDAINKGKTEKPEESKSTEKMENRGQEQAQKPDNSQSEKPTLEIVKEVPKTAPQLTFDQKLDIVKKLRELDKKRDKLLKSKEKLFNFTIGEPDSGEQITIEDAEYHKFTTSNTEVFSRVVAVIQEVIAEKIERIDKEIMETKM